jgi:hypothetical protein
MDDNDSENMDMSKITSVDSKKNGNGTMTLKKLCNQVSTFKIITYVMLFIFFLWLVALTVMLILQMTSVF